MVQKVPLIQAYVSHVMEINTYNGKNKEYLHMSVQMLTSSWWLEGTLEDTAWNTCSS